MKIFTLINNTNASQPRADQIGSWVFITTRTFPSVLYLSVEMWM